MTVVAVGLSAYAVAGTEATVKDLRREGEERRDQSCRIQERKQEADVQQLRRTYTFLLGLKPAAPLRRAVITLLPQIEDDARQDDAPPYCNAPGVGLPEPDPVVPKRPPSLR